MPNAVAPVRRRTTAGAVTLAVTVAAALAACDRTAPNGDATLRVERDTIGDTVVVRTLAGSTGGDSVRIVEELRIGEPEGSEAYTFGQVREMAVGADGTMYVYDGALRALRSYDSTGRFVHTIGREGGGPGEYREVIGLAVHPDGRLLLRDPRLGRIAVYTAAGEPLDSWPMQSGLFASDMLRTDSAGYVYARILTGAPKPGETWPFALARLDAHGAVVDTLPAPRWAEALVNTAIYDPTTLWTWHPFGYFVAAFGARYAVELRHTDGPVLRIERAGQPVLQVPADERAELDSTFSALRQRSPGPPQPAQPSIPTTKPAIRDIATGQDGRIWVRPYMPSIPRAEAADTTSPAPRRGRRWTEPIAWDVFEPDGIFLGRVPLPPRATLYAMRGDRLWGTVRDDDDVPYLVRWRIVK